MSRIAASVGSAGSSCDNALVETINGLFKTELSKPRAPWKGVDQVEFATAEWVDWFNHRRIMSTAVTSRPSSWRGPTTLATASPSMSCNCHTTESPDTPGRFTLPARGYSPRKADITARELLSEFMIAEVATRPFAALSGGEAQRFMLARSITSAPDLLLIDEPTAQLDQATAQEVISSLANLACHALTTVIATHDRQVRNACSRVLDLGIGWDTP